MEAGDIGSYYPTEGECGPSLSPRAARVVEAKGGLALIEVSLGPVSGRGPFLRRAYTPISQAPGGGMVTPGHAYERHFGALVEGSFEEDRPAAPPSISELERKIAVLTVGRDDLSVELAEIKRRLDEAERRAEDAERRAAKVAEAPAPAPAPVAAAATAPKAGK